MFKNWLAETPEFLKDLKVVVQDLALTESSGRGRRGGGSCGVSRRA